MPNSSYNAEQADAAKRIRGHVSDRELNLSVAIVLLAMKQGLFPGALSQLNVTLTEADVLASVHTLNRAGEVLR